MRALLASRGSSLEELNLSYNVQALKNAGDEGSKHSELVAALKKSKDDERDKLLNGKKKEAKSEDDDEEEEEDVGDIFVGEDGVDSA